MAFSALRMLSSLLRLAGPLVGLVMMLGMGTPAWSQDNDYQDQINDWVAKVKDRVQRSADQIPPEWRKYLPSRDAGGPYCPSGRSISVEDLNRIEIGYQAGILKIVSRDGHTLEFVKRHHGSVLKGIDSTDFAPLDDEQRDRIFAALGIRPGELDTVSNGLMHDYNGLPHTKVLAVLGVLGSTPGGGGGHVSAPTSQRIRRFLSSRLRWERDVKVHRMAVLSLALCSETDERTVAAVLDFMDATHNSWETFTVQQFFEYHHDEIRSFPNVDNVHRRLRASGNPYGPSIAANF